MPSNIKNAEHVFYNEMEITISRLFNIGVCFVILD